MLVKDARQLAQAMKVTLDEVPDSSDHLVNQVYKVEPDNDVIPANRRIKIWYSKGSKFVPDVTHMTEADANTAYEVIVELAEQGI